MKYLIATMLIFALSMPCNAGSFMGIQDDELIHGFAGISYIAIRERLGVDKYRAFAELTAISIAKEYFFDEALRHGKAEPKEMLVGIVCGWIYQQIPDKRFVVTPNTISYRQEW